MERPWMKFGTRDWLDNKELRRCSPAARAILTDLMCLGHEGVPYGHLADKVGKLTIHYMASRCIVSANVFLKAIAELKERGRINETEEGVLFIPRMVEDERVRLARAAGGPKSVDHPNTPKRRVPSMGTLPPTLASQAEGGVEGWGDSRARVRADSGSQDFDSSKQIIPFKNSPAFMRKRFEEWISLWQRVPNPETAFHAWCFCWTPETDAAIFACRDRYIASKDGQDGIFPNPDKFLNEQHTINWTGKWPAARDPPRKGGATLGELKDMMDQAWGPK